MGIVIPILIQIGCVYTEVNWIQIQTHADHLSHVECDPDLNPDSGPGAYVNTKLYSRFGTSVCSVARLLQQYQSITY